MDSSVSNFLQTLSSDSPWLWSALVLGTMGALALGLYALWEVVLRFVSKLGRRVIRSRQAGTDSGLD